LVSGRLRLHPAPQFIAGGQDKGPYDDGYYGERDSFDTFCGIGGVVLPEKSL